MRSILLVFLVIVSLGNPLKAQFQKFNKLYFGMEGLFGLPGVINQNNFGFPEMAQIPSSQYAIGVHVGMAVKYEHRFDLGLRYGRSDLRYREQYGPNNDCTIPEYTLEKDLSFSYFHIPLTYKFLVLLENTKDLTNDLAKERLNFNRPTLFFSVGPQLSLYQTADLSYRMKSDRSNGQFVQVELSDIKAGVDCYAPVERLPDFLPTDRLDLLNTWTLDIYTGLGFAFPLTYSAALLLEGFYFTSLTDLNSPATGPGDVYLWRYPTYSGSGLRPYRAALHTAVGGKVTLSFRFPKGN